MLMIASASSFRPGKRGCPTLMDLPRIIHGDLGFQGIAVHTTLLAGWESPQIDRFRDEADKAACPCLLLVEPKPQPIGAVDEKTRLNAIDRVRRVMRVAHRLGCSSATVAIKNPPGSGLSDSLCLCMKELVGEAEQLELNFLLAPAPGLTETPDQLTALIRKVGGFRIGSYPDFETATKADDLTAYLRALSPYASAISVSAYEFDKKGVHQTFDFAACIKAIRSVGYTQTMNIEYRGTEDPAAHLTAAKAVIEAVLAAEAKPKPTAPK